MAQTTRLASFRPVIIAAALSVAYCYIIAYIYNKNLVRKKKTRNEKKNTDLMAQTTRLGHLGLFSMW